MSSAFSLSWRTIVASIVAFVVVLLVFIYGIGSLLFGTLIAILTAIMVAVINYLVNSYLKPKVRLEVIGYELVPKQFGNLRGFQVKIRIKNHGKRIARKPTVSPLVKLKTDRLESFLRVDVSTEDGSKTVKCERVFNSFGFPYSLEPCPPSSTWDELRKADEISATFPFEIAHSGGSGGGRTLSTERHAIIEFKHGTYEIRVEIKCEDPQERTTVIKTWEADVDLEEGGILSKALEHNLTVASLDETHEALKR